MGEFTNVCQNKIPTQSDEETVFLFIDALKSRDFTTMKRQLSNMFLMNNLHDTYIKCLWKNSHCPRSSADISYDMSTVSNTKQYIDDCQKDLINIKPYETTDVWLLVMLTLLEPATELYYSVNRGEIHFMINSTPTDYNPPITGLVSSYLQYCLNDLALSQSTLATVRQLYSAENTDILSFIKTAKERHLDEEKTMLKWNRTLNAINIFAWLPLLLINAKRVYHGNSLRLFHYAGEGYHNKMVNTMMEIITNSMPPDSNPYVQISEIQISEIKLTYR